MLSSHWNHLKQNVFVSCVSHPQRHVMPLYCFCFAVVLAAVFLPFPQSFEVSFLFHLKSSFCFLPALLCLRPASSCSWAFLPIVLLLSPPLITLILSQRSPLLPLSLGHLISPPLPLWLPHYKAWNSVWPIRCPPPSASPPLSTASSLKSLTLPALVFRSLSRSPCPLSPARG